MVLFQQFLLGSTMLIHEGHNANLTNSNNYPGITLSSVFDKLFNIIVLHRYRVKLQSCDLQFGFKPNRSTSIILQEIISYYVNNHSRPVARIFSGVFPQSREVRK